MIRSMFLTVILAVHGLNAIRIDGRNGCSISTNKDLGSPQPLVLKVDRTIDDAFHLPVDKAGTITFVKGQYIDVACPGGKVVLNRQQTGVAIAKVGCVAGNNFEINETNYTFSDITCSKDNYSTARYTGKSCQTKFKEIEIGFDLGTQFLRQMTVCYDSFKQNTLYTSFTLTSAIRGYQRRYPRPFFLPGPFYNVGTTTVAKLYTRNVQRETINNLLGLPKDSLKYVQNNDLFLARGHLTAKADFVFGSQQNLTFYFVNAAPQWQTFNGGNWNTLEQDVRYYAGSKKTTLTVYTGTYGIATLPHEKTGKDVELHLYTGNAKNHGIPVPKLYWKVLYNSETKAGTVFLGVNNPYQKDVSKSIICNDISNQIYWLNWNRININLGYSYACTVESFRKTVTYLPDFEVTSILR